MSKISLPESERTVVFTEKEAEFIDDIKHSFNEEDAREAIEEIANNLLNCTEKISPDIGTYFFTLRQLREFHSKVMKMLAPVGETYKADRLAE